MNRDIDALIAEKVMGLWVVKNMIVTGYNEKDGIKKPCQHEEIPHYSSDIAAAFDLVKKARETFSHNEWEQFCTELCNDWRILCGGTAEYIALAALKAKGIEVE